MKKLNWYHYVRNRNLINRIYDMLEYFNFFKNKNATKKEIRDHLKNNIGNICFVECIIKYLDEKLKRNKNKVELRTNIQYLVDDLDYLKQYIEK